MNVKLPIVADGRQNDYIGLEQLSYEPLEKDITRQKKRPAFIARLVSLVSAPRLPNRTMWLFQRDIR